MTWRDELDHNEKPRRVFEVKPAALVVLFLAVVAAIAIGVTLPTNAVHEARAAAASAHRTDQRDIARIAALDKRLAEATKHDVERNAVSIAKNCADNNDTRKSALGFIVDITKNGLATSMAVLASPTSSLDEKRAAAGYIARTNAAVATAKIRFKEKVCPSAAPP